MIIDVIIPALNEEKSVGKVINDLPLGLFRFIYVADNGSTDDTKIVAKRAGAIVVQEKEKGYGAACLAALKQIEQDKKNPRPDIVLFIDGDYSDYPEQAINVVNPIIKGESDFVIGSRLLGTMEEKAMGIHQRLGNQITGKLLYFFYGVKITDLGPFRAIQYSTLLSLNMRDRNWGWTVEMQIKAAKKRIPMLEVPVNYRQRIGQSKVSGTFRGSIGAASKILWLVLYYIFAKV